MVTSNSIRAARRPRTAIDRWFRAPGYDDTDSFVDNFGRVETAKGARRGDWVNVMVEPFAV
jgi:hypothetical protein